MIVYDKMNKGQFSNHILRVAPAAEDPSCQKWRDQNGNPETIEVQFKHGRATVDDGLGAFLIAKGHARKNRPLIQA